MDHSTPTDARNASQSNDPNTNKTCASDQSPKKWVTMPDQWPQWLSKRIEFSVPVWVGAVTAVLLAWLIFD